MLRRVRTGALPWTLASAAVCFAWVAFLVATTPLPMLAWANDAAITVDGAWRLVTGQSPHRDFYSPLGALTYELVAFGLWSRGWNVAGLGHAQAAFAVLTGALLLLATWGRRSGWCTLGATLFTLTLGVAPRVMSYPYTAISYASIYNRYGFALTAVVVVALVGPAGSSAADERGGGGERRGGAREYGPAAAVGCCLALSFFLKITYFAAVLACLAVTLGPPRRACWRPWLVGVAAATAASAIVVALGDVSVSGYVADIAAASRVRGARVGIASFVDLAARSLGWFTLPYLLVLVTLLQRGRGRLGSAWRRTLLVMAALPILGVVLNDTNYREPGQTPELPLSVLAVFLWTERQAIDYGRRRGYTAPLSLLMRIVGVLVLSGELARDMRAVVFAIEQKREIARGLPHLREIAAPRWRGVPAQSANSGCEGLEYADKINEGLAALATVARADDRVAVLDFTNPFPYALGLRSPRGQPPWWHWGVNVSEAFHPSGDEAFGDVTIVMLPVCAELSLTARRLRETYGAYLEDRYVRVAETRAWVVLARPR